MEHLSLADISKSVMDVQNWPMSVWVLILVGLTTLVAHYVQRPAWPKTAPSLGPSNWPIFGAIRFFSNRGVFLKQGIRESKTGNFSFYWGKIRVVSVAGTQGRKFFFDSKDLNFPQGYAVLFGGTPSVLDESETDSFSALFSRMLPKLLRKESLSRNLPALLNDTVTNYKNIVRRCGNEGRFDPFDDLFGLVYQLTQRTVGAHEIAESPEMLDKTLKLFQLIERSVSPVRLIFPWLLTVNYFKRLFYGGQLYMIFAKLEKERKKTGHREEDGMQLMMDAGQPTARILEFVLGALFAGQLNSGINAAWGMLYLGQNAEWRAKVQAEVDGMVARHRSSPKQTPVDVLLTLSTENWEKDFPMVELMLRETIRLTMVGCGFRRNDSGKDLPIGTTGEILPKDAFAVYLIQEAHQNPEIYTEPDTFDPSRFLPDRAEDKKVPNAYVGWGTGRHPCLGMRFAKLEMSIITVFFAAMFDWTSTDANGKPYVELPMIDENRYSAHKPDFPVRLQYKVREGSF